MKAIHALLLLTFIYMTKAEVEGFSHNSCSDFAPTKKPAFSLDFCRSTNLDMGVRCCFVKLEHKTTEQRLYHCQPITADQWADIDRLEAVLEADFEVVSIECGSSYLYLSLLILIALLF